MSGHEVEQPAGNTGCGCGAAGTDEAVRERAVCGPACVEVGGGGGTSPGEVDTTGETTSVESPDRRRPAVWAPAECTLPLVQRPMRMAEFDALFAGALHAVSRPEPTRLRLLLDRAYEHAARDLAAREGACCSFFTFTFTHPADDVCCLDVTVPIEQVPVLDALAEQAVPAAGACS